VSDHAIVLVGRDGRIQAWNEQASAMFGHSSATAVGATLDLIVPPAFRERHWRGFHRAWSEGIDDGPRVAVMPVLCGDGEVRRFPARLLPIRGPHGELAAIAGIYSQPSDRDATLFEMR